MSGKGVRRRTQASRSHVALGPFVIVCIKMYRRQEPTQKNTIKIEGELFDHAEVVLLNRPYCELKRENE
jgi:hypothetical protein